MQIRDIFEKNINRNINGVVKVNDDKENVLKQELEEYVVTKELKPHFHKFFNNFAESFDSQTDKMGVWISGFFGSGKSHFLKILSYLLENKEVDGKKTIEYFRDKFDDPMEFDMIESACSKKNKTILFNVDSLSGDKTKTAIKEVFAQVFYNSLGYFGRDIKVVRFEQNLDRLGKLQLFKDKFYELNMITWEESRDAFDLYADLIVQALVDSGIMSEDAAKKTIYSEDTKVFNIDSLVDDIKAYVDSQDKDFRLVFMVDEIGQYIGEDVNLMLNLQTVVEDLGTKCKGKVWVIVTSQEQIDKVIKVKGDQFSKIMGRFDTRIHLTSSSVEEVVKKRLLAKNKTGRDCLSVVYEAKQASLKNTFTFEQATAELRGYNSVEQFVEVYPFVPYQFRLFQSVLNELRMHDQAGFDTSDNSRNMLGAFRLGIIESKGSGNVIFEDLTVGSNNNGALFSFDRFFDTISEKVNSMTRDLVNKAINAADEHLGIEKYDVCVLKLLYLIRYVDRDIKATINNIAIMMTESIDQDQIALRKKVGESLERLKMGNYVSKNGEVYTFLSNEEKEVEVEIQKTHVDTEEISRSIGDIIFGDIYPSKKAKYGIYDYEFGRFVDDLPIGPQFDAMKFTVITPGNPLSDAGGEQTLMFQSMQDNRIICVLPPENDFYNKFVDVVRVEKYNKTKNQSALPQAVKSAISARVEQAKIDRKSISAYIDVAVKNATFYIGGNKVSIKGSTSKDKIANALTELVISVYTELDKITHNYSSPDEVKALLLEEESQITGRMIPNPDAVSILETYLTLRYQSMATVTMAEIYKRYQAKPYGYRGYDIAAMVAELMKDQKVVLSYNGKEYKKNDSQITTLFFNKSYIDSVIIKQRIAIDPVLLTKCINIMKDFTNSMDVPSKEDDFIEYVNNVLSNYVNECESFLSNYNYGSYPQKDAITNAKSLYNSILLYKSDATKLLQKIKDSEVDLLDAQDDMQDISAFFKGTQKGIYDKAVLKVKFFSDDLSYINDNEKAKGALVTINAILAMPRPFSRIAELPSLTTVLETEHSTLLQSKKNDSLSKIDAIKKELATYTKEYSRDIYNSYISKLDAEISYVEGANKIVAVAAENTKIDTIKDEAIAALLNAKPISVGPDPVDPVVEEPTDIDRNELIQPRVLKTKPEVDAYINELKEKLYKYIPNGGVKIK